MVFFIVKTVVAAYLLLVCAMYFLQDRIIFPAGRDVYRTPGAYGWPYEDIVLPVQGRTTHGWYIPGEPSRGVILFSHGNAGNVADRLESAAIFRRLGFDVLLYDYGGYGKSTGRPSESRCYADVRAVWRFLTEERRIAADRIVLFGESLGGAAACDLATEVAPAAVVLQSTFLSATRLARELYPFLPARWLLRHKFDNASKVRHIACPILIIHSPEDDIIPYHHGRELFELAREPKAFLEIHGGHNDALFVSEAVFEEGIATFLEPLFKRPDSR